MCWTSACCQSNRDWSDVHSLLLYTKPFHAVYVAPCASLHSTAQRSTAQHSAAQHNTAQYGATSVVNLQVYTAVRLVVSSNGSADVSSVLIDSDTSLSAKLAVTMAADPVKAGKSFTAKLGLGRRTGTSTLDASFAPRPSISKRSAVQLCKCNRPATGTSGRWRATFSEQCMQHLPVLLLCTSAGYDPFSEDTPLHLI